ncbi:hypothetical protein PSMA108079_08665 [Pseudoalteromonas mariniglutinosa]
MLEIILATAAVFCSYFFIFDKKPVRKNKNKDSNS